VRYDKLNADLIGLFERWLTLRDRVWRDDEIRVFGSLLHRCLFSDEIWFWIQAQIDSRDPGKRIRLELTFPADLPYSRLAAIPWEYLYRPDRPGKNGIFLAADPGLILSRYIPLEDGEPENAFTPEQHLQVLVVVSQPADPRLEPVEYEDVLAAIGDACSKLGFSMTVMHNPTVEDLRQEVRQRPQPPHLVHFMGHGEFDPGLGRGSLAFSHPAGGTDWVGDHRLATVLVQDGTGPRAVVLHSCEGGRADFTVNFAGVAPQLVRSGVQCVAAMQYAVTNETAVSFSTSLYDRLADGVDLDTAVQEARSQISRGSVPPDPRLLGIPVVYLQNRTPLLQGL
jgi:CHAT domain